MRCARGEGWISSHPPPWHLANKDADGQAILIDTTHRPNAALCQKQQVLWGLRTPLPPRRKAMLAVTVRLLPPRRVNVRLVSGTPPRQHAKMSYPLPPRRVNVRLVSGTPHRQHPKMLYPLPLRRVNMQLASGSPPRQHPTIAVGGILGLRTPPPPPLRYKIAAVTRAIALTVGRCATPASGQRKGPCLRVRVAMLALAPPLLN